MRTFLQRLGPKQLHFLQLLLIVILVFIAFFVLYAISGCIMPFIVAVLVSQMIDPIIRFLMKIFRGKRQLSTVITLFIIVLPITAFLAVLIYRIVEELYNAILSVPAMYQTLSSAVEQWTKESKIFEMLIPDLEAQTIPHILGGFGVSLSGAASGLIGTIVSVISYLPQVMIFTFITLIATYFVSADRLRISQAFNRNFPQNTLDYVHGMYRGIFKSFFGYLKTQLILVTVSFVILLAAMLILGQRYAILLAVLLTFFDCIPGVGTAIILFPWAAVAFMQGNVFLGVVLITLYFVVFITRQLVEPRLMGGQTGIHPLLIMISIYAGFRIFGLVGVFVGPISTVVLVTLFRYFFGGRSFAQLLEEGPFTKRTPPPPPDTDTGEPILVAKDTDA